MSGSNRVFKYFMVPLILFLMARSPQPVGAHDVGLGLIFVEPTGISAKFWQDNTAAFTAAVGWVPGQSQSFRIHSDYLLPTTTINSWSLSTLQFYVGAGLRLKLRDGVRIGIRIPVGLEFISASRHANFFLEVVPIFQFNPKTRLFLRAGIGLRYFLSN
ncbi:hypothetical protein ACFLT9_07625 [Acidobacteriota bacterium]